MPTVNGMPTAQWWLSVGQLCRKCRAKSWPNQPAVKLHHNPQPTSLAAAALVFPKTGTQRMRVLDAIIKAGSNGMTDPELADQLGIGDNSERPRRKELLEQGWVIDSGLRRPARGLGDSIVWVLAPAATTTVRQGVG
jgi:hypothetical protein